MFQLQKFSTDKVFKRLNHVDKTDNTISQTHS